jgi:hypothetical protein
MSGKDKKDKMDKADKKRFKAQYKFEKKQAKLSQPLQEGRIEANEPTKSPEPLPEHQPAQPTTVTNVEDSAVVNKKRGSALPWYKDPNWLKAIAGIASLIVMVIALLISL